MRRVLVRVGRMLVALCGIVALTVIMAVRTPVVAQAAVTTDQLSEQVRVVSDSVALVSSTLTLVKSDVTWLKAVATENQKRIGWVRDDITALGDRVQRDTDIDIANQQRIDRNAGQIASVGVVAATAQADARRAADVAVANQERIDRNGRAVASVGAEASTAASAAQHADAVAVANQQRIDRVGAAVATVGADAAQATAVAVANQQRIDALADDVGVVASTLGTVTTQLRALADGQAELLAVSAGGGLDAESAAAIAEIRGRLAARVCEEDGATDAPPWAALSGSSDDPCLVNKRILGERIDALERVLSDRSAEQAARDQALREVIQTAADQAADDADQARADAQELREQVRQLGSPTRERGAWSEASMPRLGAWVTSVSCIGSAVGGMASDQACGAGPVVPVTAGVEIRPFDACGMGSWRTTARELAGVLVMITGVGAGLRALLSAFSMGEAIK